MTDISDDDAVISTNDDATTCKVYEPVNHLEFLIKLKLFF
jgi:hypothetical protein